MEQSPWEGNSHSASQEIPCNLCNPKVHYHVHVSLLVSEALGNFYNKLVFYSDDHPLSPLQTAYSVYLQLPSTSGGHLLHSKPEDVPCHDDKNPHNIQV
jgi:hypothetical protein